MRFSAALITAFAAITAVHALPKDLAKVSTDVSAEVKASVPAQADVDIDVGSDMEWIMVGDDDTEFDVEEEFDAEAEGGLERRAVGSVWFEAQNGGGWRTYVDNPGDWWRNTLPGRPVVRWLAIRGNLKCKFRTPAGENPVWITPGMSGPNIGVGMKVLAWKCIRR